MIELIKDVPISEILLECRKKDLDKDGKVKDKYNHSELRSIADEILKTGVVEPILVSVSKNGYSLVAGEIRLYAAHLAGFKNIDAKTGYSIIPRMQSGIVAFDEYIDSVTSECTREVYREYRNIISDFVNMIDNTSYNEIQITSCARAYAALLEVQLDKKIAINNDSLGEVSELRNSALNNVKRIIKDEFANEAYKDINSFSCNGKSLEGFEINIIEANNSVFGCSRKDVNLLENLIGEQELFDTIMGRV